jgi:hypothetical protein
MVVKLITLYVALDPEVGETLRLTYPEIIRLVTYRKNRTVFHVDITPAQESQIRSVLLDSIIKIEVV